MTSIIIGEMHDLPSARLELEIGRRMKKEIGLDYLLQENAFNYILDTPAKIRKKIKERDWMIGDVHYEMGLELNVPIIGIDLDPDIKDDYEINVDTPRDFSKSFFAREERMVEVYREYKTKGNCLLIVGDTHLRTIKCKQLGRASPLWEQFKDDPDTIFIRPEGHKREIDQNLKDPRILTYSDELILR